MLRSAVGFLLGSCALLALPALPSFVPFLAVLPLLPLLLVSCRWRPFGMALLGASLAATACWQQLDDRLAVARDGETGVIEFCIDGVVERASRFQRFIAVNPRSLGDAGRLPARLRISLYEDEPRLVPGDCWRWEAKLRAPHGFINPGGFDYEAWLFRHRIGATGYLRGSGERLPRMATGLQFMRQAVSDRIADILPAHQAGMVTALAIGERGGIDASRWNLLRDSGTAHLLAISGLHIGLVASLGWWLLGAFRRPGRWRWLPGLAMAGAYAWLAGFSLPVQRALIMLLVLVSYRLLLRRPHWSQAIGVALLAVLLRDPLAPLDPGFWLSFLAIGSILLLVVDRRERRSRRQMLRVQVGLSMLLAPVVLGHFGILSLASIPANLLAIPVFGLVIVPAILFGLAVLPSGLAVPWFSATAIAIEALLTGIEWLVSILPPLQVSLPWPLLLLLLPGLGLLAMPLAPVFRMLLLMPLLGVLLHRPVLPDMRIAFLDVGQGQAISIETPETLVIYDTGPRIGDASAAEWVVIPYLRFIGRDPDVIIASHGDSDHSGGFAVLAATWPEARRLARSSGIGAETCHAGISWRAGRWTFEFLHPRPEEWNDDNDSSCVLRVSDGWHHLLFTGDVERHSENQLQDRDAPLQADIASMPHHGSRTSSTSGFVAKVAAQDVVASAGFGNRWQLPRADVVERWRAAGARVHVTGNGGAQVFTLRQGRWEHVQWREHDRRIWRQPVR